MATKIEWTQSDDGALGETWNPLAGCTPISPGCAHCYAATMARRLEAMGHAKYAGTAERRGSVDVFTGRINFDPDALSIPLKWRKPRRVFVNSMSDLFHESVPFEFVDRVFSVMGRAWQHTFQVLTKRPERMAHFCESWVVRSGRNPALLGQPLPNVWLGTSVEDQKRADERIPHLLRCPAAVRFLSCEPLVGPVDLSEWLYTVRVEHNGDGDTEEVPCRPPLDWVIAGCESGNRRRTMQVEWVLSLADQCQQAGVAFFMKQVEVGGKVSGEMAEFPKKLQIREYPTA